MSRPRTPLLAADTVIELSERPGCPIVLIERRFPPLGWALPGGFVEVGERLERAAIREAYEETRLRVELVALLGCYSEPSRDPRGHTVSVVYVGRAAGTPGAADDARTAGVFALDQLPGPLAFDHAVILRDYQCWRQTGKGAPLRL